MTTKLSKGETLRMFDHTTKLYTRVKLSDNKKYYEKWVSTDGENWELDKRLHSFDQVMLTQQELINNNFKNLFKKIISK